MKTDITVLTVTLVVSFVFAFAVTIIGTLSSTLKAENKETDTIINNNVYYDNSITNEDNINNDNKDSIINTGNDKDIESSNDKNSYTSISNRQMPYTLKKLKEADYYALSITGLTFKKEDTEVLAERYKEYGTLIGTGMSVEEYKDAMRAEWIDCTEYNKRLEDLYIDLNEEIRYKDYERYLKLMSRYEGVYLYKIGNSTDGRPLYAIEIDMPSEYEKETFILTGQTHTREYAGGIFILKQLCELIMASQSDDEVMELLKHYRYAAVPIISVDVREYIIDDAIKWSKGNQLYKAYANGTDGNRNYPGINWGQLEKENRFYAIIETEPGYANYPGDYAGSSSETKAMMKWFYHYVVVEKALIHLDYHQQGSIIYAGKPWQTKKQEERCINLANELCSILNDNNRRKYTYSAEAEQYGLRGEGATATDFTVSLAAGARFSPAFGYFVMTDNLKEYPLIELKKINNELYGFTEANEFFATATFEIGYGKNYLGYTEEIREYLAEEYDNYNFSKVLLKLPELAKKVCITS